MASEASFINQVAIVTGAARGIGFAAAKKLAQSHAKVCLVDLNAQSIDEAKVRLVQQVSGADVIAVAGDVADVVTGDRIVKACVDKWSRVDILVQAAGIVGNTNITTDQVDPDNFDEVLRVNLRGIFVMCRAVLPTMKAQNYGRIVNIASISGKEGNAGMLAYSTSKAGVIGLTKVIGKEFATTGITCNCIAPAVVRTEMVAAMPDAQVKYMTDKIPMQRTGELDEVAALICFIAGPSCSFTTGFCFDCTGGRATY